MEKKKNTLDVISSFFKGSNKKQDACADTSNMTKVEEDKWMLLLENQIDERGVHYQQIAVFLVVLGIVLIYVNYFDVLLVTIGKDTGLIISRIINLMGAFVITVTGLVMWEH
ncbi:unnamed protein product [Withania somnifera]